MGNRALVAETREGGTLVYSYDHWGVGSAQPQKGKFLNPEMDEQISEKYPDEDDLNEVESLEELVSLLCSDTSMVKAVWIDGKFYTKISGRPLLVQCKTKGEYIDSRSDVFTEFGAIDEDFIENTDRDIIDFREKE